MSIWRNKPLKHIVFKKPITIIKENFIIMLTIKLSELSSYYTILFKNINFKTFFYK